MHIFRHIWFICIIAILSGCAADRKKDRYAIAVSFEPQAWLTKEIVGDDFDIVTLLPAGSDPEVYQPSISTMKSLGNASIYFTLGTDGFEESLIDNISKNFPNLKIVDSASEVDKIFGSHGNIYHDDHSDSFDPHILASLRNCIQIAETITETLSSSYPEKSTKYQETGKNLIARLTSLDDSISAMRLEGKPFVIRHPSLEYYARDYRVRQIALNDVGKETSPSQLKKRIDEAADLKPTVMVVEKEHEYSSDYDAARQLGVDTIKVSLNSPSWINDLMRISHEINRD